MVQFLFHIVVYFILKGTLKKMENNSKGKGVSSGRNQIFVFLNYRHMYVMRIVSYSQLIDSFQLILKLEEKPWLMSVIYQAKLQGMMTLNICECLPTLKGLA